MNTTKGKNGKIYLRGKCKTCQSGEWGIYYDENKEVLLQKQKDNPEQNRRKAKQYQSKPENKKKINTRRRLNYESDKNLRLRNKYRKETHKHLLLIKNVKYANFLSCSSVFFRQWIESQFTSGMKWENYGRYWELDHIFPVSIFDLTVQENIRLCYHWENVRPCLKSHNKMKTNKIYPKHIIIQELKSFLYKKSLSTHLLPPNRRNLTWGTRLMVVSNGNNANAIENPQPNF